MTLRRMAARLAGSLFLAVVVAFPSPSRAQSAAIDPSYVDGKIRCPDGSTREPVVRGAAPDGLVMRLACETVALSARPASPPHPVIDGRVRCDDGTTRKFSGPTASDLSVRILCITPEDDPAYDKALKEAVDRKNHDAGLRAALRGEKGVWEGLKASWEARSLDYLLRFPLVLAALAGLALLLLSRIFKRR